jgi:hypothetical protein
MKLLQATNRSQHAANALKLLRLMNPPYFNPRIPTSAPSLFSTRRPKRFRYGRADRGRSQSA